VDDIAQGLMGALARAQQAGVVHRDIKPGNVLLTRCDGRWVPKLIDFGLAKEPGDADELTVTGQVMGTPGYMPLSQMSDAKHVDGTVDTYALGAVLYELTTGRRLVPSSKRVSPDVVGRALYDLSQTDVPGRMQQAIMAAVHATRASRSAGDVLAFWQGAPGSSELAWRSWGLLVVLSTFAALWLALGILALG
ncbi:MAG: protein kinase, partial [Myxococcota bacterium]